MDICKENVVVILQARTNSSRLPAKILLPLAEIPLVILAAKRAANTGRKVIVVTSDNETDDYLCNILNTENIEYFRGQLNNVLHRYVSALKGYPDNTIVVRLTADNSFIDGSLIDELIDEFKKNKLSNLSINGLQSGVPYGISAEVTYLSYLNEANANVESIYDQEHVTPYIYKMYGQNFYKKYLHYDMGTYRCTIDCFEDYISVQKIFSTIDNPIHASWKELIQYLKPIELNSHKKENKSLVLGSAQLGLDYGINNPCGKINPEVRNLILKTAIDNGLEYIDTARMYGNSEYLIGEYKESLNLPLKIITKMKPISNDLSKYSDQFIIETVKSSLFESLYALKSDYIDVYMVHRVKDLYLNKKIVLNLLSNYKKDNLINHIGASVQTPKELEQVISNDLINFIQIPYNILDYRWDETLKLIKEEKAKRSLTIHARSVFLQGLLLSRKEQHWNIANIQNYLEVWDWLNKCVQEFDRKNVMDLCMTYVLSQGWIDALVIGVDSLEQFKENLSCLELSRMTNITLETINNTRPRISENSLNPVFWNKL